MHLVAPKRPALSGQLYHEKPLYKVQHEFLSVLALGATWCMKKGSKSCPLWGSKHHSSSCFPSPSRDLRPASALHRHNAFNAFSLYHLGRAHTDKTLPYLCEPGCSDTGRWRSHTISFPLFLTIAKVQKPYQGHAV